MTSPTAPPTLPQYIADGLPKQDDQTLRDAQEFIDELLATRDQRHEQPISEDGLPADAEDVKDESSGTVYLEYRTCGNEICLCMSDGKKHGPYKYRA